MKRKKNLKVMIILLVALLVAPFTKVEAITKNNNPLLAEIKVDGEALAEFGQFITDYVMAVDGDEEKVNIEVETDDPNATYELIGDTNLKMGVNDFEIKVTAEDGTTTYSYFLHITKGDTQKANANLKNIEIKGIELNPKFNEKDTTYLAEYEGYIKNLEITATPESDKAKVEILDNNGFNSTIHIVTIKVTAEDGVTTKEYKINAKKAGESVEDPSGLEEYEEVIEQEKSNKTAWIIGGIVAVIAIGVVVFIVIKKKK